MMTVEMISATMKVIRVNEYDTMQDRLAFFAFKGVVNGYTTNTGTGPGLSS
jgi:hypothetical protein